MCEIRNYSSSNFFDDLSPKKKKKKSNFTIFIWYSFIYNETNIILKSNNSNDIISESN